MSKQITISLPHNLSEAEVKSRLASAITDARAKHPAALKSATETWNGNRMDFRATAMGQTITGSVDIQPKVVHVSVDLPFMLAMLANRIRPQIESEGRKLLTGPQRRTG